MKIAIMQPYFIPYIGYFSLIKEVDVFIFFDDVQYIRRGWINRNRIKINNECKYITLPVIKSPISTLIMDIEISNDEKQINNIKKTISHAYKKAPFFKEIYEIVSNELVINTKLRDININIINKICEYLSIDTYKENSSSIERNRNLKKHEALIEICKKYGCNHYINPIGGINLYSKEIFLSSGITLNFLKIHDDIQYHQGKGDFIPNLSIIDILMWNSIEVANELICMYKLI